MGLLGNGSVLNKDNGYATSGIASQCCGAGGSHKNGIHRNRHWFLPKESSTPEGYGQDSIKWPQKSGGLGSSTSLAGDGEISSSSDLAQGVGVSVSMAGSGTISSADILLLIDLLSSLSGSGTITNAEIAMSQSLEAALLGSGTISVADLGAIVDMISSLSGSGAFSGSMVSNAILTADISPFTELSPEALAAAVLNAILAEYNEAGSVGEALNNIGASANPWAAALAANTTDGTFGKRVQELLTTNKFIGLK